MAEQDKGKSSGLQLDSTKKYTLVFLVSLGTTLLVTGFSGGRLLKRAKQDATPAATAAAAGTARGAAADGAAAKSEIAAKVKAATAANAAASTEKDGYTRAFERAQSQPSTSTAPTLQAPSISASLQPRRSRARRNSLLASWWTSAHGPDLSFWLSNPSLVKMSLMAAEEDKRIERGGVARASGTALPLYPDDGRPQLAPQRVHVHGQGSKWREAHESAPETEDRFNAAFYAFKAFGIATVLTTSGFAAGIFLLMRHYKVDNVSRSQGAVTLISRADRCAFDRRQTLLSRCQSRCISASVATSSSASYQTGLVSPPHRPKHKARSSLPTLRHQTKRQRKWRESKQATGTSSSASWTLRRVRILLDDESAGSPSKSQRDIPHEASSPSETTKQLFLPLAAAVSSHVPKPRQRWRCPRALRLRLGCLTRARKGEAAQHHGTRSTIAGPSATTSKAVQALFTRRPCPAPSMPRPRAGRRAIRPRSQILSASQTREVIPRAVSSAQTSSLADALPVYQSYLLAADGATMATIPAAPPPSSAPCSTVSCLSPTWAGTSTCARVVVHCCRSASLSLSRCLDIYSGAIPPIIRTSWCLDRGGQMSLTPLLLQDRTHNRTWLVHGECVIGRLAASWRA